MKPLDTTKQAIIDPETRERFTSAFDVIKDVKEELKRMGLEDYPTPKTRPTALSEIDNIDTLPNQELGGLYVRYTAHAQFINAKLAEMEASYKIAVSNLKHLVAELTAKFHTAGIPKVEISAKVHADPIYQEMDIELVKLFAMKTVLEAHHRAYDKQASALSRMIALRELEFQQTLREGGIKKTGARIRANTDLRKT